MQLIDVTSFIKTHITGRKESLFAHDIARHQQLLFENIHKKRVLVIGGAGTIGSSYIKAILPFQPASLTVVDYSENELTELTRDLRSDTKMVVPSHYITYPFDFGSPIFEKLIRKQPFDIVACFAAHKHVRSEKDHLAIEAMINNNVFNTQKLLETLLPMPPQHIFSVSTDKAANPVNVMGASKKLMEKVLMAYSTEMQITTARFANVAFSNGSLLYGFLQRMMKRQPLSSPADVRRYFVSPLESGELCMLASLLGDSGDIFFPKLGQDQMLTFAEIAERFLAEIGLVPDYCTSEQEAKEKAAVWENDQSTYPVYFFTSDTSGEKMYEEFYDESDVLDLNSFEQLGIVKSRNAPSIDKIHLLIEEFKSLFSGDISKDNIISLLNKHLPDFSHIETGKSLDAKM
ncbi:MAG: polysaccharide biosynthesis protein [Saprospiraceae bacterium]|nr:polysaccharide biosynthesis protein [Saprospiraceae bacterium]